MRALKRSTVAGNRKLPVMNWEQSSKQLLLQLHKKVPKNSMLTILGSFNIWGKLEKVKNFNKWVPHELTENFKKSPFWSTYCLLLFYTITMNHFSIGLWHAKKSEFYTTTSDDQLSGWTKKKLQSTFQSEICTQNRSWSLFGGLLPIGPTITFWIPAKSLYLRSMLSKLMRYIESFNSCSWHWSTGRAQFSFTTMSSRMSHNCFKSRTNWAI